MNATLFRRFACRPAAFLAIWGGQPKGEAPLADFKLHAARFRVCVDLAALAGVDENTGIVSTEPEWGGNIYTNKITAFEAGKTYHYGVYVTAYTADISPDAKLKINGREVEYTRIGDESDTQSFWVETNLTMTPAADGHTHSYGTDWEYDSTNHWHECSCGDKSDLTAHSFKWLVDKEATAAEKGSKHEECSVCGYKKAAVEIPATGSATQPTDPTKPAENKPGNTTSPKTGDNSNMLLWIALLFVSGGAVIGTTVYGRKKKAVQNKFK